MYNDATGIDGTPYTYWVMTMNGCGTVTWYSESVPAADNVGTAPSSMATAAVDNHAALDTGVDISWPAPFLWGDNENNLGARAFHVYRDMTLIGSFGVLTTNMNDNGGINGVNYSYHVDAVNGCGGTVSYSGQFAIDAVAVSPGESSPAGTSMTAVSSLGTSIQVTYTGTSCDTDHSVYWGESSGALTLLNWNGVSCLRGDSGSATFDPGNPQAGSFFYFVIVGNNGADEGSYGRDSAGSERPPAGGIIACASSQNLAPCIP